MGSSLFAPVSEQKTDRRSAADSSGEREVIAAHCVECEAEGVRWPVRFSSGRDLVVCSSCGGWSDQKGETLLPCSGCSMPVSSGNRSHAECAGEEGPRSADGAAVDPEELECRAFDALSETYPVVTPPDVLDYAGGVLAKIGAGPLAELSFIDLGEPATVALPGGRIVSSLGLFVALEDEAQLAFVLARELALARNGRVYRRFVRAAAEGTGLWKRISGSTNAPMRHAAEMSLLIGYGSDAERAADREALATIVHADYDAAAAVRAMRRLADGAVSGNGGRYLLADDRANWLEESARGLGRSASARLNREVYRRAVDGFRVYEWRTA